MPGKNYEKPQGVQVAIHVDDPEEAERNFAALAEGGDVTMPLEESFWATRFGMHHLNGQVGYVSEYVSAFSLV